jgi:hypothetical protein
MAAGDLTVCPAAFASLTTSNSGYDPPPGTVKGRTDSTVVTWEGWGFELRQCFAIKQAHFGKGLDGRWTGETEKDRVMNSRSFPVEPATAAGVESVARLLSSAHCISGKSRAASPRAVMGCRAGWGRDG